MKTNSISKDEEWQSVHCQNLQAFHMKYTDDDSGSSTALRSPHSQSTLQPSMLPTAAHRYNRHRGKRAVGPCSGVAACGVAGELCSSTPEDLTGGRRAES